MSWFCQCQHHPTFSFSCNKRRHASNAGKQCRRAGKCARARTSKQGVAPARLHLHLRREETQPAQQKQSQHGGNQTPRRLGSRHEVCHEHRQHRGQAPTTGALACSGCSPCAQVGKRARVRGCSWSMLWGSGDGFLELGQSPNLEIKIYIFFRPND